MENILKGIEYIYDELSKVYPKVKQLNIENIKPEDILIKKKIIRENGYSGSLRINKEGIRLEIQENDAFIELIQRHKKHKILFNIPKADNISILHVLYDPDTETPEFSLKYINLKKEDGDKGLLIVDKKDAKTKIIKIKE
jgi:hypothetical protein